MYQHKSEIIETKLRKIKAMMSTSSSEWYRL